MFTERLQSFKSNLQAYGWNISRFEPVAFPLKPTICGFFLLPYGLSSGRPSQVSQSNISTTIGPGIYSTATPDMTSLTILPAGFSRKKTVENFMRIHAYRGQSASQTCRI